MSLSTDQLFHEPAKVWRNRNQAAGQHPDTEVRTPVLLDRWVKQVTGVKVVSSKEPSMYDRPCKKWPETNNHANADNESTERLLSLEIGQDGQADHESSGKEKCQL